MARARSRRRRSSRPRTGLPRGGGVAGVLGGIRGLNDVKTAEIAKLAGMNESTLFRHVGKRDVLVADAINWCWAEVNQRIAEAHHADPKFGLTACEMMMADLSAFLDLFDDETGQLVGTGAMLSFRRAEQLTDGYDCEAQLAFRRRLELLASALPNSLDDDGLGGRLGDDRDDGDLDVIATYLTNFLSTVWFSWLADPRQPQARRTAHVAARAAPARADAQDGRRPGSRGRRRRSPAAIGARGLTRRPPCWRRGAVICEHTGHRTHRESRKDGPMSTTLKPGMRLFSAVCSAELIAVKAPAGEVELTIGGAAPVASAADRRRFGLGRRWPRWRRRDGQALRRRGRHDRTPLHQAGRRASRRSTAHRWCSRKPKRSPPATETLHPGPVPG